MGFDQIEAEDASVIDVNRPGSDRILGGFCLAFADLRDDQQFREPGFDVDMEVEAGPSLAA